MEEAFKPSNQKENTASAVVFESITQKENQVEERNNQGTIRDDLGLI